jgi:hypothetical protein
MQGTHAGSGRECNGRRWEQEDRQSCARAIAAWAMTARGWRRRGRAAGDGGGSIPQIWRWRWRWRCWQKQSRAATQVTERADDWVAAEADGPLSVVAGSLACDWRRRRGRTEESGTRPRSVCGVGNGRSRGWARMVGVCRVSRGVGCFGIGRGSRRMQVRIRWKGGGQ